MDKVSQSRILNSHLPPTPSVRANHAWLTAHRHAYKGRWIALRAGELLGVADDLETLVHAIGNIQGILLTRA